MMYKLFLLLFFFISTFVMAQEPAITSEKVSRAIYEGASINATEEITLLPGFAGPAGFTAQMVMAVESTSDINCATATRDTTEFMALPWFDNNQYLDNLLDSLGFPFENNCTTCRIEDNNTVRYRIPIKFWVYRDDAGTILTTQPTEEDIRDLLDRVNEDHRQNRTGIRFYQSCGISFINSTKHQEITDVGSYFLSNYITGRKLPGVINVHFVERIGTGNGSAGLYNPFTNSVFVIYGTATTNGSSTLTHEIGHFLELDHTHQYANFDWWLGLRNCFKEPVDRQRTFAVVSACRKERSRKKCESTGDGLCDTPADLNLSRIALTNCAYTGTSLDEYGDSYAVPPAGSLPVDPRNIMSYAFTRTCRNDLTTQQIGVMLHSIERGKQKFDVSGWKSDRVVFDQSEPNNNRNVARPFPLNQTDLLTFHHTYIGKAAVSPAQFETCDVDWFRFTVPIATNVRILTSAEPSKAQPNTRITLFDINGVMIAQNDDIASGNNLFSEINTGNLNANVEYFVQVENLTPGVVGFYNLFIGCLPTNITITSSATTVCATPSITFSATAVAGAQYSWTQSSNLEYVSGQGTANYSVKAISSGSGSGWVEARIDGACGGIPVRRDIEYVGIPTIFNVDVHQESSSGYTVAIIDAVPGADTRAYEWYLDGQHTASIGNTREVFFYPPCGNHTLSVRALTTCGWTDRSEPITFNGCFSAFVISPNPASNEVEIAFSAHKEDEDNALLMKASRISSSMQESITNQDFEVKVYDTFNQLRLTGNSRNREQKVRLNTAQLQTGIYVVHIISQNNIEKKRLEILK